MSKRVVIVGGVAGGASAAARLRRLDEKAEIIIIERGPYISYANCGLPYHIGKVIKDRDDLILQDPESFKKRLNIDVFVETEALKIFPQTKELLVKDLKNNQERTIKYDYLILSPGAYSVKPPIPGIDLKNVFTLRTIPDMDAIINYLETNPVQHATVIGAGFIGLEIAENLRHRGINVSIIEKEKQVMPPLDFEMASLLHKHLRFHGIDLRLGQIVTGLHQAGSRTAIHFSEGAPLETDIIILATGVKPEVKLAKEAGLELGPLGGIKVNGQMQTSDPFIYAVGDAIETIDMISEKPTMVWLAGPANREGRTAADAISGTLRKEFKGTIGTWICKVFDLTVAATGLSEKQAKKLGISYKKTYVSPPSHAGYYPGAYPLTIKLLFSPTDGKVLGASIVGSDGVDKRIDVIATCIYAKLTVEDLANLELAYAPPYGSAKDPVNIVGMNASNILYGIMDSITPDEISNLSPGSYVLLDVRTVEEHSVGRIPGSLNIPVDELRSRLSEIPQNKQIITYCQVGLRGYIAQRILKQNGYNARNLLGGYKVWCMYNEEALTEPVIPKPIGEDISSSAKHYTKLKSQAEKEVIELDTCGLQCPGPLLKLKQKMDSLQPGQVVKVIATDSGFLSDAASWCNQTGNKLLESYTEDGRYIALIEKTYLSLNPSIACATSTAITQKSNSATIILFSGDLDKALAAFIIANGAAGMGMNVAIFFTFWGLNAIKKANPPHVEKTLIEKAFDFMMPKGADSLPLSKMNFAGLGKLMMKYVMDSKNVTSLPELIRTAKQNGVKLIACSMSMDVMGIKASELIEGVDIGGVATYINLASKAGINLFI